MLNLSSIMLGSADPKKLGEFYASVFEKPADMADKDGNMFGWVVGNGYLNVIEHSKVHGESKEPERVILNFETTKVKEEFARIKGLGAEVVAEPYEIEGMWIATFADPDGNYFQLMPPWDGDGKK